MAKKSKKDEVLARVDPSPGRRWFGIIVLFALGGLLLWLGFQATGVGTGNALALASQAGFIVAGLFSLWVGRVLWRSTARGIVLTDAGLHDTDGRELAAMDNIARVDRSVFAFKPSNGFLVILERPTGAAWQPGLWWRSGKRIGIGGVCNAGETRAMADILSFRLVELGKTDR